MNYEEANDLYKQSSRNVFSRFIKKKVSWAIITSLKKVFSSSFFLNINNYIAKLSTCGQFYIFNNI